MPKRVFVQGAVQKTRDGSVAHRYAARFVVAPDDARVGDEIDVEGVPHEVVEVGLDHVVVQPRQAG